MKQSKQERISELEQKIAGIATVPGSSGGWMRLRVWREENDRRKSILEYRKGEGGVHGTFIPFLKEGQPIDVIICTPKGWNPLEERGFIVPGSQTGQCDTCGQDIWIAHPPKK